MPSLPRLFLLLFVLFWVLPLAVSAALYWREGQGAGWRTADRSSVGSLPPAARSGAVVRVFAADGAQAAALVPQIQGAIAAYAWRNQGDYRAWPGPNSNTFVAAVLDALPGVRAVLPPTAIGKDYPYDGRWLRWTPSGTGVRLTLGGVFGITLAWVEGIEVSILGGVAGLDLRRPAIKLPGLGRLGMRGPDGPATPLPAVR